MKRLWTFWALLILTTRVLAETHVPAGSVSGVWTVGGSPFIIEGNVIVETASSLTINPGVTVIMNPWCRFRIEGQLQAVGTINDSIRFLASDTAIGNEGLHFLNTDFSPRDSSKLIYCELSYGTATGVPDPYQHGGGIYAKNSSRLLISHCYLHHCRTINAAGANGANGSGGYPLGNPGSPGSSIRAGNGGALYVENCALEVEFCLFAYNHTGDGRGGNGGNGASVSNGSGFNLRGGTGGAGGDGYGGQGGAIALKNSASHLHDNVFHDNHSGAGYGGLGGSGGNALADSGAYGGVGRAGGVGSGGEGGAIYTELCAVQMDNNLFYDNGTGNGTGGAGGNGGTATVSPQYPWTAHPGNGGGGGSGYGGGGYALFAANSPFDGVRNGTITAHLLLSVGQGGAGGFSGGGIQAAPGQGSSGRAIIGGPALLVVNSIVWNNADPVIEPTVTVSYSDIQGGHEGLQNIIADPLFINPAANNYLLAQFAAGQPRQSPCVDAGNPVSVRMVGTTRTDSVQDLLVIDMGYHYPIGSSNILPVFIELNPINPPILIPASGGSFDFTGAVSNEWSETVPLNVWIMQRTPSGLWQGPLLGPLEFSLNSGSSLSRLRTQTVPGSAQPGIYTYKGYVGLYPEVRWDSSSFVYEKLAAGGNAQLPLTNDQWLCTGEPFPCEVFPPLSRGVRGDLFRGDLVTTFPNPFNPTTVASFELRVPSKVSLKVYDTTGRLVATLVEGWRDAGSHEVTFDGSRLSSGLYFVKVQAGSFGAVKKVVLVK